MKLINADGLKKYFFRPYSNEEVYSNVDIEEIIDVQPTVEPNRWIPCSEKLPEKWGDYLVTMKWKGVGSDTVYIETNMAVYNKRAKKWDHPDVIAWMPLPEPYQERKNG